MKFVLLVEGGTEKALPAFLKRWLDVRLDVPVGIQAIPFHGWGELITAAPKRTALYLNSPKREVIAVVALLDLYGLGLPYPPNQRTVQERCAWAKQYLEDQVGHAKFRQFFAVHETEAWLLSDVGIFPVGIRAALAGRSQQPEAVNSGEPPAKLLDRLYLNKTGRGYEKVTNGAKLFTQLSPEIAYHKCPHLRMMLDEMLQLALAVGA